MADAQICEVRPTLAPLNLYCMTVGALNTGAGGWILTLGVLCSSSIEEIYISLELYLLNYCNEQYLKKKKFQNCVLLFLYYYEVIVSNNVYVFLK
jgi:hypothetical protein